MLWAFLAIAILLVFSAFFSGSETALFSLTPGQREELKTARPRASRRVEALLGRPDRLLGTLLLGNLIVNTTASSLLTLVLIGMAHRAGHSEALYLGLGGIVMTAGLLVFGEVTPKVAASRIPSILARYVARPLDIACFLLRPFVSLLLRVSSALAPGQHEPATLSDDELRTMIDLGRKRGVLHGTEDEILLNLVDLDRRTVSEVMTPRIDIMAVPETATVAEALKRARDVGFSRLPVYRGTKDTIIGTLHVKELLAAPDLQASATALARQPFFVPEVKRLPEMLDELRRRGSHIAVVVDEFGQTAGLVTLEDLLEAVFGEITDEHDLAEELPYTRIDESGYLVDGEIDVATLNRLFHNAFLRLGHERLSSFIHDRLGRLPVAGDKVTHRDLEIAVQETAGTKIEKVIVRKKH